MRSPTLEFEKFGTYQSSAMVPCFRTKSLMDLSLLLYSSTVGFTFCLCVSWGSLSVRCAIALVCTPVLLVGISLCPSFILCLRSLLVIVSLSLSQLSLLLSLSSCCYLLLLCCLSRESLLLNWLVYFGTSGQSVNLLITGLLFIVS